MKIKVTDKCRTLNGVAVKADSIHEVESHIARNLIKKGFAVPHDDEAKRIDLDEPSRLTEEQADANAEAIHDKRLADKEKSESAHKKKR